jgi:hypothetical protein
MYLLAIPTTTRVLPLGVLLRFEARSTMTTGQMQPKSDGSFFDPSARKALMDMENGRMGRIGRFRGQISLGTSVRLGA